MKITEYFSIIAGMISIIGVLITGILGEYSTSIIAGVVLVFAWLLYLTSKYFQLNLGMQLKKRKEDILTNFPYKPKYEFIGKEPILINKDHKRVIIQADFLNWERFTIVFWAYINETLIESNNNRYLFSFRSNSDKEESMFFGIKRYGLKKNEPEWRLVLKGKNESDNRILFHSNESLKGWKHFVLSYSKSSNELRFYIDGGNVLGKTMTIEENELPKPKINDNFFFGGWFDWKDGISKTNFFSIRIFQDSINQGSSLDLFNLENKYIDKLKLKKH